MQQTINNDIYNTLGERWYTAYDDPVALLRQESKIKAPWVVERIFKHFHSRLAEATEGAVLAQPIQILDVGCGAGFLSNHLAELSQGRLQITGLDMSGESLAVAHRHDSTGSVKYCQGDAARLPYKDASFDVVTAMDFLEHVENPAAIIKEISRVLKPGGQFFFHTFNRNWLAHIMVIKMVEWLVKNTPDHMHVIEMFITPEELTQYCSESGLTVNEMTGIRPLFSTLNLRDVLARTVPKDFSFALTTSLKISYLGVATKTTRTVSSSLEKSADEVTY